MAFKMLVLICFAEFFSYISSNGVDNNNPVRSIKLNPVDVEAIENTDAVLDCLSNAGNYTFSYWFVEGKGEVIGPGNDFNWRKYSYEIPFGNLTIQNVTKEDEGLYNCASRNADNNKHLKITPVKVIVIQKRYWDITGANILIVVLSATLIVILITAVYIVYGLWRNRYKYPIYSVPSEDEDDDEIFEELIRATGSSRSDKLTTGFENPILATDFNTILDTRRSK